MLVEAEGADRFRRLDHGEAREIGDGKFADADVAGHFIQPGAVADLTEFGLAFLGAGTTQLFAELGVEDGFGVALVESGGTLFDAPVAAAAGAPAVGRIVGEKARIEILEGASRLGVHHLGVHHMEPVRRIKETQGVFAEAQGRLDEGEDLGPRGLHEDLADNDIDAVFLETLERFEVGHGDESSVDEEGFVVVFPRPFRDLGVEPLAAADEWGEDAHGAAFLRCLGAEAGDNGRGALFLDGVAGVGRVLAADLRVEEAQEMPDLGDGGDGRFAAAARDALLDRDGGRETGDEVDVRTLHLLDELPRIGRHAVEETALSLGKEDVESQGRLARSTEPRDDDELIARDREGEVFEVVLPRSVEGNRVRDFRGRRSEVGGQGLI